MLEFLSLKRILSSCFIFLALLSAPVLAQDTTDDEDFSMYDDLDFADEGAKRYTTQKVIGMSPARLISIGYDFEGGQELTAGAFGGQNSEKMKINSVSGLRLEANVPVYSRNSLIVQLGMTYWESNFSVDNPDTFQNDFNYLLANYTHRTTGLNTTIFKPFDETRFMVVQGSADLNGDYKLSEFQSLKYTRYSLAALYGWKKSDRLMYAFGLARTYRVGEINYVPIVMYNWTSAGLKWGAEVLFPARAHMRYNFDPRNMLLFGFELQGQSYRMNNSGSRTWGTENFDNIELRRGAIRPRVQYLRQLSGFVWLGAEVGYRINYRFHGDHLENGDEFLRLFNILDDRPYPIENELSNTWYFNFSISLVSP